MGYHYVNAFGDGEMDALENRGNRKSKYRKDQRKAYQNGYNFGQQLRAVTKRASNKSKRG